MGEVYDEYRNENNQRESEQSKISNPICSIEETTNTFTPSKVG